MSHNVAGRLKHYLWFWKTLTDDHNILQTVRGLKLDFIDAEIPVQERVPSQMGFNLAEAQAIKTEISRLCNKGVVKPCRHEPGQYINTIFTRPKKDGSHRMILNLKPLNQHILYKKFKMDTLKTVLQLVQRDCFMASIDIADAYYTVPIHTAYQKYLKFQWQGMLYQYTALPNGYSDAPRVFTKLLKPVFAQLRRLGHVVVGYIDDIYLQGNTELECHKAVKTATELLENCGFVIHQEKSCFVPAKRAVYLGFEINSAEMTVSLTEDKKLKYIQSCDSLAKLDTVSIRELACVIGKIISTFPGVPFGPLHYRTLELAKIKALHMNDQKFDASVKISDDMKAELRWWSESLLDAKNVITKGSIDIEMMTDATLTNWGAKCGVSTAGGVFTPQELLRTKGNINACEMLAVFLSLQAFLFQLKGKKVLIRSDNMTTIAYIAHMGGTKSAICNSLAYEIWTWCQGHDIWLSAEHIAGIQNIHADYESRHLDDRLEWALYPEIFDKLCHKFGTPSIDLFASRINMKLGKFVSWRPEPGAYSVNAFAMSWENEYVYIFPPFSLILRCLHKVLKERTDALLIAPLWATQPWFSLMSSLLVAVPVILPKDRSLYLPNQPQKKHPLRQLRLIACKLSGDPAKQDSFRTKLLTSSVTHGGRAPRNSMALSFKNGHNLLVQDTLITIGPL